MYEGLAEMRENARVSGEYRGDYQELVDEISALLGVPATLENRDFELIAFGAYDSEGDLDPSALDPVRTRSILTRRSTTAVRTWFEGFGITRATGPVRIPRPRRRASTGAGSACRSAIGVSCSGTSGCSTTTRDPRTPSWPRPCR